VVEESLCQEREDVRARELNHPRGALLYLLDGQARSVCRLILAAFLRDITGCIGFGVSLRGRGRCIKQTVSYMEKLFRPRALLSGLYVR
jgi:hypothetical protein